MSLYYTDDSVTLYHGDALDVLRELPDASVNCCVTSPPYFGLRDYGVEGQYGLEESPAEYVEVMRALFAELRRVLADDGTCWINIGDSYSQSGGHTAHGVTSAFAARAVRSAQGIRDQIGDRPPKNLLGVPWRLAFALQNDGWTLRNAIVWHKPNAMPESVTDRLSNRYEPLFLFSKSRRYWFDLDLIREPHVYPENNNRDRSRAERGQIGAPQQNRGGLHELGRNPGDVWTIATQPFSEAHFAVMPQALAERAILAGCKPGGTVLDPFSGSGTTGLAATKHGRRYVGIDLNTDYLDLSLRTRLAQTALIDGESA